MYIFIFISFSFKDDFTERIIGLEMSHDIQHTKLMNNNFFWDPYFKELSEL